MRILVTFLFHDNMPLGEGVRWENRVLGHPAAILSLKSDYLDLAANATISTACLS